MLVVLVLVVGVSIGKLLNLVAGRLLDKGFLATSMPSVEMIPVFGHMWLMVSNRRKGVSVQYRVFVVEVATGVLFVATYIKFGMGFDFVTVCGSLSLLGVIAIIDLERGLIPNRVLFIGVVIFMVVAPFWTTIGVPRPFLASTDVLASFGNSALAGVGSFLMFLLVYLFHPQGIGAGDVKLAGLVGLMVGFPALLVALWGGVISAGIYAVFLLLVRGKNKQYEIPFGPFLSVAAAMSLLWGVDILEACQRVVILLYS